VYTVKKFAQFLTLKPYILLNFSENFFQCVNFGVSANQSTNQITHLGFLFTFLP
jgi:hypothetical protein